MSKLQVLYFPVILLLVTLQASMGGQITLDEAEPEVGDWGYRQAQGQISKVNPPSFVWRYQKDMTWQIQCALDKEFKEITYQVEQVEFNVHCPPEVFSPGSYFWRYRGRDAKGQYTQWSQVRQFSIAKDAVSFPMPTRQELLRRIPKEHPRLFMRPENLQKLSALARGEMKKEYEQLVDQCEEILASPPPTAEPPLYPPNTVRLSEQWKKMWWGNRTYTVKALNSAATLAFTRLLGGQEKYGQLAKHILLECAKWDPKGSTGYRYNDEAGMPYNYHFVRTYTFLNDMLSEEEKEICRRVMKVRGEEMYHHLWPRHFWQPYHSHQNRAWHYLGEIGITFLGEIEEAEDWLWFATNVFFNVYPVWCDDDGGWHEGMLYWISYLNRFTWWADVMREAVGIDAYKKPYFSQVGYYVMYLMPPGKVGGGFGDLTAFWKSKRNASIMTVFATQAHNPYWQWYVEQVGGPEPVPGYIGFIRGALPKVEPKSPVDLPTSRLFRGTGQAYLNSNLLDATKSVQVVFKSSPFGTQSHGYEANNSFLLWAYGQRLLIRTGYRDIYGSEHHKQWMWSTRSVNNITVNGEGQEKHTATVGGEITDFKTTDSVDIVVGEAGEAYEYLDRFTRAIIFVKPELVVIYDRLVAKEPASYEYWLHALKKIEVKDQHHIHLRSEDVLCDINFLTPTGLQFEQTDQYDPNPRPRIKLREWHLTGKTTEKKKTIEFVTLYRPGRIKDKIPTGAELKQITGGYILQVELSGGNMIALLPTNDQAVLKAEELASQGKIKLRLQQQGKVEVIGLEK